MMKDIISQFRTAQNILLSLNSKRLSFAYLIKALSIVLKEKGIDLKIHCNSQELKSELIDLDPYFQNKFVEKIDKSAYTIRLNKNSKGLEISDTIIDSSDLTLKFESNSGDLTIKDFEVINNTAKCDLAIFLGNFSDKQINNIRQLDQLKKKFLVNNKKSKKQLTNTSINIIELSNIEFFIQLIKSIDFNNKNEVYTLILTSILIETNNLSNSLTPKYLKFVKDLLEEGAVLSISQNYLSKNSLSDMHIFGTLLSKFIEIEKQIYICELNNNQFLISDNLINDLLYISKKIKAHKLIIIKVISPEKTTLYLTSRHPSVDLSILKKKYSGSGNKEFYKFSFKVDQLDLISDILDLLNLDHTFKRSTQTDIKEKKPIIINPINNQNIRQEIVNREVPIIRNQPIYQEQVRQNSNQFDPLQPAINIPEPIFLEKRTPAQAPQKSGPLPSAAI